MLYGGIRKALRRGIRIPRIESRVNSPLESWHHGKRVDPKTWPWWLRFRFSHVRIGPDVELRHKRLSQVGRCYKDACQPESMPAHFENCRPRIYERFYLYTRHRAYDVDIRVE